MDADLSLYWTKEWLPAEFVPMPVVPCKIEISRLVPKQRKKKNKNLISAAHNIKGLITSFRIGLDWDGTIHTGIPFFFNYYFQGLVRS